MKTIKKIIDILMMLILIIQMGYVFTGNSLHEVLGISLFVLFIVHNILNYRWYTSLRKGTYNKKRTINTIVIFMLWAVMLAMIVSSLSISTFIFSAINLPYDLKTVHTYGAIILLVLMVIHAGMHALAHARGKKPVIILSILAVFCLALGLFGIPFLERHYKTIEISSGDIYDISIADTGAKNIATVYFTLLGNADFESDIDATSTASLLIDRDTAALYGNCEVLAKMINASVGGDLEAITVADHYPSGYTDTVMMAGKQLDGNDAVKLTSHHDLRGKDTIYLVFPIWWGTLPPPVTSFLDSHDLSGATIIPVVAHGGSGFGGTIKALKEHTKANVSEDGLAVYCMDTPNFGEEIYTWLNN